MVLPRLPLLWLLVLAACGAPAQPPAPLVCGDGQRPNGSGDGCEPVPPAENCPAGQMPRLGTDTCHPVGWTACPDGFATDASGWGCRDVSPSGLCTGATMPRLGQAACQPVGDCAAAFPPADATYFVDASYTAGQLDATHFKSVVAAVAAAPANAVVAVEAGVYPESLNLLRPVRLVGRCAAQVRLTSTSGQYTAIGVRGVRGVEVSGFTVDKHLYAVAVFGGGSVTVKDSVLEDNVALGLYASDPNSLVRLERSVVRATRPEGNNGGWGLLADLGASAELVDSALEGNTESGAVVRNAGSTLSLQGGLITRSRPNAAGASGAAILVNRGGRLEAQRSALTGNAETALIIAGEDVAGLPSSADLADVVIRDTLPLGYSRAPAGDVPQYLGRGISVQQNGRLAARRCALTANHELGLAVSGPGSQVQLRDCTVSGTLGNVDGFLGRGVAVFGGGSLTLGNSALVANREVGLDVTGAGSLAAVDGSLVLSTGRSAASGFVGFAALSSEGARIDLVASALMKTDGIGVTVSNASASLAASIVSDNAVGLQTQAGVTLSEVGAMPAEVQSLSCLVTTDTAFLRNGVRLGSGTQPLPPTLVAPAR
jgi:hypothetical protein